MNQPRTLRQAAIAMGWVREDAPESAQRTAEMRLRRLIGRRVAKGAADPRFQLGHSRLLWYTNLEKLYDCVPQLRPRPHRVEVNPRLLVTRMKEVAEEAAEEAIAELRPRVAECYEMLQAVANHIGTGKAAFGPSSSETDGVVGGATSEHDHLPWLRSGSK